MDGDRNGSYRQFISTCAAFQCKIFLDRPHTKRRSCVPMFNYDILLICSMLYLRVTCFTKRAMLGLRCWAGGRINVYFLWYCRPSKSRNVRVDLIKLCAPIKCIITDASLVDPFLCWQLLPFITCIAWRRFPD